VAANTVTGNFVHGGGIYNGRTVIRNAGSVVTGNRPDDCFNC
jgi:hypothetical protein